jgi:hypothetical protein
MYGIDLTLKQLITEARCSDFLREAERERSIRLALAARPAKRRAMLDGARTSVASALLRAGHRLMPADARDASGRVRTAAFELSPGQ